jgi:hypothetical protein
MSIVTRAEFEKLPRHEQLIHLTQISPKGFLIVHDRHNGFHAISQAHHRKGSVIHEEMPLGLFLQQQNLSSFCVVCGIDVHHQDAVPVVSHIFQDGTGVRHVFHICGNCGKSKYARDIPRLLHEFSKNSSGNMGTLSWLVQALRHLQRWRGRREDFSRAMLLSYK